MKTADDLLQELKGLAESQKMLNSKLMGDYGFTLEVLLGGEHTVLEELRQDVAKMKLELLKAQDKKNVAAVEIEVEASDEYRMFRLQEHKCERIEEFVKLCKKSMSQY